MLHIQHVGTGMYVNHEYVDGEHILDWIRDHADRQYAIKADSAVSDNLRRNDEPNGNIAGLFALEPIFQQLASGSDIA